ncbi:GNAT family N-acetyltransferase [Mycobacterium sp. EPG1]|nr:GNAT family N-acetyltransferase [Mycobacterium sp. EPG1]
MAVTVRAATPDDADAICAIYAHYVRSGVATFEVEPPARDEILRRMDAVTAAGLPYLVATLDGPVAGYAYCAPWKTRPAYRFTVEDSVYVAPDALGRGVGGALLDALIAWCGQAGVRQMIAVVVDADAEGSLTLHRRRGFADAGRLVRVGFKHDRWLDTILLQKSLD